MSEAQPRVTILGDGWFRDNQVFLDTNGERKQREWLILNGHEYTDNVAHAIQLARNSELHGGGWDLPADPRELLTLADYDQCNPAVIPELRDVLKGDWYWTKKPVASNPSYAWCADLYGGFVGNYHRGNGDLLALACRAVSPSQ